MLSDTNQFGLTTKSKMRQIDREASPWPASIVFFPPILI
jgi:hypothetical protein